MFEVPAGGRRYRALELLVKQKRLAKTAPVPCIVSDSTEITAEEDSLAENVHRVALHPLDQFRAFQTLREQGRSEEDIPAIFFVSVNVVKQRLRLAAVSPNLLDVYADDGMSLEQLMAFSVAASFPYGHDQGHRRLQGTPADPTSEEQASFDALQAEYDALQAKYEDADELPDEVDARLGELEEALEAFANRPDVFKPAEIVHAGAFVSIDGEGGLQVERGYVRREDETAFVAATIEPDSEASAGTSDADAGDQSAPPIQRATITVAGQTDVDEEADDDSIRPLPDRLVAELTAHRTLALRDAVACHPQVAMTALLHKLCVDAFYQTYTPGCLEVSVRHVQLPGQTPDLKESASAKSITDRHAAWRADMPTDEQALWDC